MLLHYFKIITPIENLFVRIFNPIFSNFYSISSSIRERYEDKKTNENLTTDNEKLTIQNRFLIEENAKLKTVDEENRILREYLGFISKNEYKSVMGNIVFRGSLSGETDIVDTITIDKGSKNGVEVGQAVVGSKGIVVGKIIEAKDYISRACLTNSKRCKFAVTVQNEDRTSGVIEGSLGLTIKMSFIPQDRKIEKDDMIVTSGLENMVQKGLVIGRVIKVEKESNELWQYATIEPIISHDELTIVSVLTK